MTNYRWIILLLCSIVVVCASEGDIQPYFKKCVDKCVQLTCPSFDVIDTSLIQWTCPENCRYECMQNITDKAIQERTVVYQYFGKWPLYRICGMQQPASVIFSIGNFCVHFYYCIVLSTIVPFNYRLKGFMILYTALAMHAWIWSINFHAKNTRTSEMMDCFSTGLFVLYTLYFALLRVFCVQNGAMIRWTGTTFICLFVAHVGYLIIVRYNSVYKMYATVIVGLCQIAIWVYWYVVQVIQKQVRPYAHLAVISKVGVAIAMCLGLLHFSPLWRAFDAHSLWHMSTIPLSITWYRFLVKDMHYETKSIHSSAFKLLPS